MRSRRSTILALLPVISLALAACDKTRNEQCPGRVIAALALHGDLDASATGCAVPPSGGWSVPATIPDGQPEGTFDAVFTWNDAAQQLAYCSGGPHAAILYGTRSGDHLHAQVTLAGAVLGSCASTCTPLVTVAVDGDLAPAATPVTFSGTLTETFDQSAASCAPCQLPCTSTYTLSGTGQ